MQEKCNCRCSNSYLSLLLRFYLFFRSIGLDLDNPGQDCFEGCNGIQGKCSWCGSDGYCCRKGWTGNGCDGSFGGHDFHGCFLNPNDGNLIF